MLSWERKLARDENNVVFLLQVLKNPVHLSQFSHQSHLSATVIQLVDLSKWRWLCLAGERELTEKREVDIGGGKETGRVVRTWWKTPELRIMSLERSKDVSFISSQTWTTLSSSSSANCACLQHRHVNLWGAKRRFTFKGCAPISSLFIVYRESHSMKFDLGITQDKACQQGWN